MCLTVPTTFGLGLRENEVWAPIIKPNSVSRPGVHRRVRIIDVGEEFLPLCTSLVGIEVCTIFSGELFGTHPSARVAYATEVAKIVRDCGYTAQAEALLQLTGTFGFYICQPRMFTFI